MKGNTVRGRREAVYVQLYTAICKCTCKPEITSLSPAQGSSAFYFEISCLPWVPPFAYSLALICLHIIYDVPLPSFFTFLCISLSAVSSSVERFPFLLRVLLLVLLRPRVVELPCRIGESPWLLDDEYRDPLMLSQQCELQERWGKVKNGVQFVSILLFI